MSTTNAVASATSAAASASASIVSGVESNPSSYKAIGICCAVGSGLFIGSSFVIKKKGLIASRAKVGGEAGEGSAYLKSWLWWTGMSMMIVGEILNFVAYAFTEAILVTPLGALSVVICAILSSIFLKEKLTFFGKIGCFLAILGSVIIALNGPQEQSTTTILEFRKLFIAPGFLVYASLVILGSLGLAFFVAPKYGKTHMLVYITICSLIGGLSVACTSGLGSSILTSIRGDNQFKQWFIWFLLVFVAITLVVEILFLNKALELFNTAMVTPTYYVIFTGATLITSVILNQGFKASVVDIVTVVLGFLVICCGITLLQLSKVNPADVAAPGVDRRSTMLLSASRARMNVDEDSEKGLEVEDPGMDSLRGTFGAFGSIHRAVSARRSMRSRVNRTGAPGAMGSGPTESGAPMRVLRGVSLHDNPMPYDAADKISFHSNDNGSLASPNPRYVSGDENRERSSSITFAQTDAVHMYPHDPHGSATHHDQSLVANSHMHLPPPPRSADIGSSDFASAATSAPGGYSPASPSAYDDPYDRKEYSRSQTMPRQACAPLAGRLSQHYAASSPDGARSVSPRGRFGLPSFSREHSKEGRRTPHSSGGAKDADEDETEGLVTAGQAPGRRGSLDSEDGLERYETRDEL